MKDKILKIIKQPSTWRGLFMTFAGSYGLYKHGFDPTYTGLLIAGVVGLITDDEIGSAAKRGVEDAISEINKNNNKF